MRFTRTVAIASITLAIAVELAVGINWFLSEQKREIATLQMGDAYHLKMIARKGVTDFKIKPGGCKWCEVGSFDWYWTRQPINEHSAELSAFDFQIGFPFSNGPETHIGAPHWFWMLLAGALLAPAWIHRRLGKQRPNKPQK